jgi:hypothetical protein
MIHHYHLGHSSDFLLELSQFYRRSLTLPIGWMSSLTSRVDFFVPSWPFASMKTVVAVANAIVMPRIPAMNVFL